MASETAAGDGGRGEVPGMAPPEGGDDALLAVLLGDPPPADPTGRAEYERAARDMETLRRGLRALGGALAEEPPGEASGEAASGASGETSEEAVGVILGAAREEPPAPVGNRPEPATAPPARRRHLLRFVLAACAAGAIGLGGFAAVQREVSMEAQSVREGGAKLTASGIVACSNVIAEGTVARTERAGARTRVVLDVARYLVPEYRADERKPPETAFTVPAAEAASFVIGKRVLVQVPVFPDEPVMEFSGAAEIAGGWEWFSAALPGSRAAGCTHPG
ncbi:hypothetical protein ACFVIM_34450 [Streptomyces sp. NPDC057638]|uniref:hypothetical protein n=1 Tax=Streptomyces sp. NPDC057638 TaxID=3346190 RepID=UPI00369EF1D3